MLHQLAMSCCFLTSSLGLLIENGESERQSERVRERESITEHCSTTYYFLELSLSIFLKKMMMMKILFTCISSVAHKRRIRIESLVINSRRCPARYFSTLR